MLGKLVWWSAGVLVVGKTILTIDELREKYGPKIMAMLAARRDMPEIEVNENR